MGVWGLGFRASGGVAWFWFVVLVCRGTFEVGTR